MPRISSDRYPREGALMLYRGLVKESRGESCASVREQMRIMELLSFIKPASSKNQRPTSQQRSNSLLGLYARKKNETISQASSSFVSRPESTISSTKPSKSPRGSSNNKMAKSKMKKQSDNYYESNPRKGPKSKGYSHITRKFAQFDKACI